jgi:hypothetical protein
MNTSLRRWTSVPCLCLALLAAPTALRAAEPLSFMATTQVAGERLQLNGGGSFYKAAFRVFDAALYTRNPVRSEPAFEGLAGAKRLHFVAARDIRSSELLDLLVLRAVAMASPDDAVRLTAGMSQMASRLKSSLQLKRGDSFGFDFVPGRGTLLLINGDPMGSPMVDAGLFNLLLQPWLGAYPADIALKQALLGQAEPQSPSQLVARR